MPAYRRDAPLAWVLAVVVVLLAGCREPERPASQLTADSIAADYAACRQRAAGDSRQLIACADAAVTAAAPGAAAPGFAALGDAANALAGDNLSRQVGVSDALASLAIERATLREGEVLPRADELAVPAVLATAGAPIMADACRGARDAITCEAGRSRLLPRLAARLAALSTREPGSEAKAAPLGGYLPPTCEAVHATTADVALAQFESEFPAALKDERLVETIALSEDQVRAISAYLACLAARSDFAPDVIDSSLTFFSSRQSGARARAALERLGKESGSDAAAAREFASQVADYLAAPEG